MYANDRPECSTYVYAVVVLNIDLGELVMDLAVRLASEWPRLHLDVRASPPAWIPHDAHGIAVAMQRSLLGFCRADQAGLESASTMWLAVHAEGGLMSIALEHNGRPLPVDEWRTLWLPALVHGSASASPVADMLDIDELRAVGGDISIGYGNGATSVVLSGRTPEAKRPHPDRG